MLSEITEIVSDGEAAVERLLDDSKPLPSLVLLDLNLPKCSGFDVLIAVKEHERSRRVPVIVMTTSSRDEDKLRSYGLHANAYVRKSAEFEGLIEQIKKLEAFWFDLVDLPPAFHT